MLVRVAVEGCCHGELTKVYQAVMPLRPSILLICGDFQAVRDADDLELLAVPNKYRKMGDFHEYLSGQRQAPVLTVVIGGNHELSRYFKELPFGGWIAPRIYYMGYTNVVWFKGVRIGGMLGIYNPHSFARERPLDPVFRQPELRLAYHVRRQDLFRMLLQREGHPMDVAMSHDWPQGVERHGDLKQLLRKKKHLRQDVQLGQLGNPAWREVLRAVRPRQWVAAHLHVYYTAEVRHEGVAGGAAGANSDEIDLGLDETDLGLDGTDAGSGETEAGSANTIAQPVDRTVFTAFDKVMPGRRFYSVLDVPVLDAAHPLVDSDELVLDRRMVAVHQYMASAPAYPATVEAIAAALLAGHLEAVRRLEQALPQSLLPPSFAPTPGTGQFNPQTLQFAETFGLVLGA